MKKRALFLPRQWELVWFTIRKSGDNAGLYTAYGSSRRFKGKRRRLVAVFEVHRGGVQDHQLRVYTCRPNRVWNGELRATRLMEAGEFFPRNNLPLDLMPVADREWLPRILNDRVRLIGKIYYSRDGLTLERPSEYTVVPRGKPLE